MAATSASKPGIGAVVYRNTGTYGSPTWTAQALVQSVSGGKVWKWAEAGARETRAELSVKTRVDLTRKIVMRGDDANAGAVAFMDAADSPTSKLDLMILNAAITVEGARGVRAEFLINETEEAQELEGSINPEFECKPASTSNGFPSSVTMGASSVPAFTAF